MPRLNEAKKPRSIEEYGERIAKYIPAEVLAFYTAAVSLIATKNPDQSRPFRIWAFGLSVIVLCIVTPLWIGRFINYKPGEIRTNQIVALAASIVWAYSFPAGWFVEMRLYDSVIAGLSLILFTIVSALITPGGAGRQQ